MSHEFCEGHKDATEPEMVAAAERFNQFLAKHVADSNRLCGGVFDEQHPIREELTQKLLEFLFSALHKFDESLPDGLTVEEVFVAVNQLYLSHIAAVFEETTNPLFLDRVSLNHSAMKCFTCEKHFKPHVEMKMPSGSSAVN